MKNCKPSINENETKTDLAIGDPKREASKS
jgi:hypothetical protein